MRPVAGHVARKRFGQHFLVDASVIAAIVAAIDPREGQVIVEIGPGLAALTEALLERVPRLHAVEIDRDLAARLRRRWGPQRLELHEADALHFDFSRIAAGGDAAAPLRLVGNLPYNISSPLLFHLMASAPAIIDQHFMLQREVIDRMVAKPRTADYGRLSVMLQSRYAMHKLFDVPPEAFNPPPRVVSAVVRMVPLPETRRRPASQAAFEQVVARAFAQRRKMLRRGLAEWVSAIDWQGLGIPETDRAEELSVDQFMALADHLHAAGLAGAHDAAT